MKKLLLSIGLLMAVIACSSDDDAKSNEVETYIDENEFYNTIELAAGEDCLNSERAIYCVEEAEYMRVFNLSVPACTFIEFEDVDGVQREGYKLSMNTTNETGCLRNK